MSGKKIIAESWPRTFKDLMAKTRAEVRQSRFVSSEHRWARIPEEEYLEDAQSELRSVIRSLESLADTSDDGSDIDFDEMQDAVKNLDYAADALSQVSGHENEVRQVQHVDGQLAKMVREVNDEYKRWEREQSRHRVEVMGLADNAGDLAKILKGIRL